MIPGTTRCFFFFSDIWDCVYNARRPLLFVDCCGCGYLTSFVRFWFWILFFSLSIFSLLLFTLVDRSSFVFSWCCLRVCLFVEISSRTVDASSAGEKWLWEKSKWYSCENKEFLYENIEAKKLTSMSLSLRFQITVYIEGIHKAYTHSQYTSQLTHQRSRSAHILRNIDKEIEINLHENKRKKKKNTTTTMMLKKKCEANTQTYTRILSYENKSEHVCKRIDFVWTGNSKTYISTEIVKESAHYHKTLHTTHYTYVNDWILFVRFVFSLARSLVGHWAYYSHRVYFNVHTFDQFDALQHTHTHCPIARQISKWSETYTQTHSLTHLVSILLNICSSFCIRVDF